MESPLSSSFMTCFNRKHRISQCLILQYKPHLWYARGWLVPPSFSQFRSSPKAGPDPTTLNPMGTNFPPPEIQCPPGLQPCRCLRREFGLPLEREFGFAAHMNMNLQFFIIIATRHDVRIIILHLYRGLDSKSLLEPDRTEQHINLKSKPNMSS